MASPRPSVHVARSITQLTASHFDSELARTTFNDAGRASQLPERIRRLLENRLLAWVKRAGTSTVMTWGGRVDAALVPRLSPPAFRSFCATLVARHPQALEVMPHCRHNVLALARAVHVSQHINPAILGRLMTALSNEGLTREP